MRNIAGMFIVLLLAGCASTPPIPPNYSGSDAGKIVVGIGAAAGTNYSSYSFLFRRVDQRSLPKDQQQVGRLMFLQNNIFSSNEPDYDTSSEQGEVLVQSIPAAKYEIFNFDIYDNGYVERNFSSRVDFSIPFTVEAGKITYLGNYQANKLMGKNYFGLPIPAGALFVVSDRAQNDLEIAYRKKEIPEIGANNSTPTVDSIGNPLFIEPSSIVIE
ncbi:MAG: hypothetical protein MI754_14965 [Chromatiales bacterium]|nr:hypothetical protein [Chromatiales bacterium]